MNFNLSLSRIRTVLIIGIVAAVVRVIESAYFPSGLTWDEAVITFDAWGIANDGMDHWGQKIPLIFRSFGDGKLPMMHYLLAAVIKACGFNVLNIRYLSLVISVGIVLMIYLLSLQLRRDESDRQATYAVFVTLCLPWWTLFGQLGLEANLALLLGLMGILMIKKSNGVMLNLTGSLCLLGAMYSYHSALIFIPIITMVLLLKYKRPIWIALIVMVGILPLIVALDAEGWSRLNQTMVRSWTWHKLVDNFLAHFSWPFLVGGKQDNLRQAIPGFFIMLWPQLVMVIYGLIKNWRKWWVWVWLAGAIAPSIIGVPSPHTIRAYFLMPLLPILASEISRTKRLIVIILSGWMIISFTSMMKYYLFQYPRESERSMGYEYENLFKILLPYQNEVDKLVISTDYGQPFVYAALYNNITPKEFREGGLANFEFKKIMWPQEKGSIVFVGTPNEIDINDPRVIQIIPFTGTNEAAWVIAR